MFKIEYHTGEVEYKKFSSIKEGFDYIYHTLTDKLVRSYEYIKISS